MNPADFVPGPVIDTPELLRDVLRCKDAIWFDGLLLSCAQAVERYGHHDLTECCRRGRIRRACLRSG